MITETINGVEYNFFHLHGKVVGKDKNSITEVYGGGGGESTYRGTGFNTPVSITSVTTIKDSIFLVDNTGKEHRLSLTNWDVACREGHEMAFVWAVRKGAAKGEYLAIKNLTTNTVQTAKNFLKSMSKYGVLKLALIIDIPLMLFVYFATEEKIDDYHWGHGTNHAIVFGIIGLIIAVFLNKALYRTSEYNKILLTIQNIFSSLKQ